jgi:hypothetical protein
MSDTDRLYRLLKREGSRGVHTLDLRREQISGNPSQRATDIEKKYGVQIERERERRGDRNGSRYKLIGLGAGTSQGAPSSAQSGQSSRPSSESEPQPGSSGSGTAVKLARAAAAVGDAKANPKIGGEKTRTSGRSDSEAQLFDFDPPKAPNAYDPYSEAA